MALEDAGSLIKPAIIGGAVIGIAALGFATGGLLAATTVAVIGRVFGQALGESAKDLTKIGIEKFTEYFVDGAAEPAIDGFRKSHPTLEDIYREAFRLSLFSIRPEGVRAMEKKSDAEALRFDLGRIDGGVSSLYGDWFENWNAGLKKEVTLSFEGIDLQGLDKTQLDADTAARCFRATMERIDAQGALIRSNKNSLALTFRSVPEELLEELRGRLPECFPPFFRGLLVKPQNATAMNESELLFRDQFIAAFEHIKEGLGEIKETVTTVAKDTARLPRMEETLNALAARTTIDTDISEFSRGFRSLTLITDDFQKTLSGELAEAKKKREDAERERDEAKEKAREMAAKCALLELENHVLEGQLNAILSLAQAPRSVRR